MKSFREILKNFKTLEERSGRYIYPQVVKEVFGIPTGQAIFFLELASRAGHLRPTYEVRCPSCDRIIGSFRYRYEIPKCISCDAEDDHQSFIKSKHQNLITKVYTRND